jgi:hypothetical protein
MLIRLDWHIARPMCTRSSGPRQRATGHARRGIGGKTIRRRGCATSRPVPQVGRVNSAKTRQTIAGMIGEKPWRPALQRGRELPVVFVHRSAVCSTPHGFCRAPGEMPLPVATQVRQDSAIMKGVSSASGGRSA